MSCIKSSLKKYQKLVLGTYNLGKIKEMRSILSTLFEGYEFPSAQELGIKDIEETGTTFKENAQLKSQFYSKSSSLPAIPDDSGLVIPFLDGFPGVFSARIAEKEGGRDFSHAFSLIAEKLKERGVDPCDLKSKPQRKAFFVSGLSLFLPDGNECYIERECHGHVVFPPRTGSKGHGYDPIFIKNGMKYTFAEISDEEKNKISHRAKAFQRLKDILMPLND